MTASHDQRVTPGRRTIRRRLPDAPGCADWNEAIHRARADYEEHPAPRFCAYRNHEDEWCVNESGVRTYCSGHAAFLARCAR